MKPLERRTFVYIIAGLIALGLVVFGGIWLVRSMSNPYRGLVTYLDVQMEARTRTLLEQRIATMRAAMVAAEQAGDSVTAQQWYDLAMDYYVLGDLVPAREALEETLNLGSNYAVGWNSYGNVLGEMGDLSAAADAYKQALELVPNENFILDYTNFVQRYLPDRKDDARVVLEAAVATLGQKRGLMVALADWHYADGNCEQAMAHYEVARQLEPDNDALLEGYNEMKNQCSAQ